MNQLDLLFKMSLLVGLWELFKWESFQKNLVFLENALPGQGKKAIP